jgi:hypothetical protein
MPRTLSILLLTFAMSALSGCYWGEADANMFFKVSGANADQFKDLLYPAEREEAWTELFSARPSVCADRSDDCGIETTRSDLVDLFLPYESSYGRGLLTQKGDLQITTHLDVGDSYQSLIDDSFGGWNYMEDPEQVYGWTGDTCAPPEEGVSTNRSGVGRCLKKELQDNSSAYTGLAEDLRLVILINIISSDDVRSVDCQDALSRDPWVYPKTLRVNYNANQPMNRIEGDDGSGEVYGDDERQPLLQCDIEVFARLQLGIERFEADFYGEEPTLEEGELNPFTLDRVNDADSTIRGTVELESLQLPDDGDDPRAVGRFDIAFTSDRFGGRDGKVIVGGDFNVQIRTDAEELQVPERETEIGGFDSGE